jgi:hypothetical protein
MEVAAELMLELEAVLVEECAMDDALEDEGVEDEFSVDDVFEDELVMAPVETELELDVPELATGESALHAFRSSAEVQIIKKISSRSRCILTIILSMLRVAANCV